MPPCSPFSYTMLVIPALSLSRWVSTQINVCLGGWVGGGDLWVYKVVSADVCISVQGCVCVCLFLSMREIEQKCILGNMGGASSQPESEQLMKCERSWQKSSHMGCVYNFRFSSLRTVHNDLELRLFFQPSNKSWGFTCPLFCSRRVNLIRKQR